MMFASMSDLFSDCAQIYQRKASESLSPDDLAHAKRYRVAFDISVQCSKVEAENKVLKAQNDHLIDLLAKCRDIVIGDNNWDATALSAESISDPNVIPLLIEEKLNMLKGEK